VRRVFIRKLEIRTLAKSPLGLGELAVGPSLPVILGAKKVS